MEGQDQDTIACQITVLFRGRGRLCFAQNEYETAAAGSLKGMK